MSKAKKEEQLILPYGFEPRWYQLEAFKAVDNGTRFILQVWCRRAGKDLGDWNLMVMQAFKKPGVYYYFFPTYEQGRKAVWENIDNGGRRLTDYVPGFNMKTPNPYVKRISNQSMVIELTNGSIIRIVAADKVEDSIVGTNPAMCVYSEYSLQDPMGLKLMMPVHEANKGIVVINGTPRGRNHLYQLYQRVKDDPNWFTSVLTIEDLQLYTKKDIDAQVKSYHAVGMTDDEIAQEMYCSWSAGIRGAYYADLLEKATIDGRIQDFPPHPERYVDTFWDLGVSDDTTIWFRQIIDGRVVFIDYYQESGQPLSHYVQMLDEKGYNYRTHYIPHDGGNRRDLGHRVATTEELLGELMRDAKMSDDVVVVPKMKVQQGINKVRDRFGLYHFSQERCHEGLKALEAYHRKWNAKAGVYSQHPAHDWASHAADALRVEAVSEVPMLETNSPWTVRLNTDFDIED